MAASPEQQAHQAIRRKSLRESRLLGQEQRCLRNQQVPLREDLLSPFWWEGNAGRPRSESEAKSGGSAGAREGLAAPGTDLATASTFIRDVRKSGAPASALPFAPVPIPAHIGAVFVILPRFHSQYTSCPYTGPNLLSRLRTVPPKHAPVGFALRLAVYSVPLPYLSTSSLLGSRTVQNGGKWPFKPFLAFPAPRSVLLRQAR